MDPPAAPAAEPFDGAFQDDAAFVLQLESYAGPIDVLLEKAREQKVDLAQISILALADQYLAFIERARRLRLELAADYLVMAAWLAYLKSRLLLPARPGDEEPTGEELAAALTRQLRRLEAMRQAGLRLMAQPRLGIDVFARGEAEAPVVVRRAVWSASIHDLLSAYAASRRRAAPAPSLRIEASTLLAMSDALARLEAMLGAVPSWSTLASFLPDPAGDPLVDRSALAAFFTACLELARTGKIALRQAEPFAPLYLRSRESG